MRSATTDVSHCTTHPDGFAPVHVGQVLLALPAHSLLAGTAIEQPTTAPAECGGSRSEFPYVVRNRFSGTIRRMEKVRKAPRGTRKRDVPLTKDGIYAMALQLIDADGVEALTMRKLATALDANPMSLYHHVQIGRAHV